MNNLDHIVVDVEIREEIGVNGITWNDTHRLGISVAVVYEFLTDRFITYSGEPNSILRLRERLMKADRISGYNIINFDFPVIMGHVKSEWAVLKDVTGSPERKLVLSSNDILRRLWIGRGLDPDNFVPMTHGNAKLDQVAGATIGRGKIAAGEDAPRWWKEGRIHDIITYCLDDVALERDLSIFADRYGYVIDKGRKLDLGPAGM